MRRSSVVLSGLLLGACAIPNTIESLDDRTPPPEFGRPVWVRTCAGVGAWIGGIGGGIASVVLLPVTWPISKVAGDSLGEQASSEFVLFPAIAGASFGHAFFGLPADVLDYGFRRVWVEPSPPLTGYDFVPMVPMVLPEAAPGAGGEGAGAGAGNGAK
ncbi:MAG: hypothetical protein MUC36_02010 [Planctomycetes bacterium]|nr:hypothetical protein [Planctomycetota bacterium]